MEKGNIKLNSDDKVVEALSILLENMLYYNVTTMDIEVDGITTRVKIIGVNN